MATVNSVPIEDTFAEAFPMTAARVLVTAETIERWNPANHVRNWRTPMLVLHGAKDYRVPYTQGIAAFTALQRRGIESRLVMYPDENHWILKPANSVQWHREVLGWLDAYLKK